ncbi:hypothetical protein [Marinicauda algicola]|uniref:hypothetical protein n=1 Tax=Marinicauda algicola TaxID=2029849 RepID=UPI0010947F3C|nr:hypothetical protein [Marinicauda algicola]
MTHAARINVRTSIAAFALAVISLALVLSSPALAELAHEQEACASAHHDEACCMDAMSAEMDAQAASKAGGADHVCDEASCAMMISCAPATAILASGGEDAALAIPLDHGAARYTSPHASASVDGLKRPPRA